jgi:hypothetical protein
MANDNPQKVRKSCEFEKKSGALPKQLVLWETHWATPSPSERLNIALKQQTKNIGS